MIVTRRWLEEFVDLDGVSDSEIYETLNRIGLEVDRMQKIEIPSKVVVGKILSCEKHPDADKLNVCQVDVGTGVRQIVCGAANVVDAEYVAVATIGAVLPGDFEIKHAKLRGVESAGMICSATEVGLPETEKGIMILDESIGTLEPGRELNSYDAVADTIIELELTANRGDCLSVYGVARDLAVGLGKKLQKPEYQVEEKTRLGIGREMLLHVEGESDADVQYRLLTIETIDPSFLIRLRLAMVEKSYGSKLEALFAYANHATGVLLRHYKSDAFLDESGKIALRIVHQDKGYNSVEGAQRCGVLGAYAQGECLATDAQSKVVVEASYVRPELIVEAVAEHALPTDALYYQSSRGSNPDIVMGMRYVANLLQASGEVAFYEGVLEVETEREPLKMALSSEQLSTLIGMEVEQGRIARILQDLGFDVQSKDDKQLVVTVPYFRQDIRNVQDVAEEIVRIVGIDNIPPRALCFTEKPRLNEAASRHRFKRALRERASGVGFFETVGYLFCDRALLERYGFETLESSLELSNPITEELNTLRTTLLINLLLAAKRNALYSIRRIPLFEIGTVVDAKRNEKERIAFVLSGAGEPESVANCGKAHDAEFETFVRLLGGVIGSFMLHPLSETFGLMHPYRSAVLHIDGKRCGIIGQLHPEAQEDFGLRRTFVAELDVDALLPSARYAQAISNFQGVYKDLSVVIDDTIAYDKVREAIASIRSPILKRFYPIDLYRDESLGAQKSLTIRFFVQSDKGTLSDEAIEALMEEILGTLNHTFGAKLR